MKHGGARMGPFQTQVTFLINKDVLAEFDKNIQRQYGAAKRSYVLTQMIEAYNRALRESKETQ